MTVSRHSVVRAARHQISCRLDDEAALLNLETGVYYGLDPMGAYIWQQLTEPIEVRALTEQIAREYQVDSATVEADVSRFLEEMIDAGLVQLSATGV